MRTARARGIIPDAAWLALACLALASSPGLGLVPTGDVAARTEADTEQACPTHDGPILDRTRLPCGTVGCVSPETSEGILRQRERPTLPHYVDTEHFRIWYDTSGPDSIFGWPDTTFLHECKVVAERSWRGLVDTLGFRPPPPDGGDPDGGGGSDHYDIYLLNLGFMGEVPPGSPTPGGPPNDFTSYMKVDNDFAESTWYPPIDSARVTIAHEFGHSLEYAHQEAFAMWWCEAVAMWTSEEMYDYIDWHLVEWEGDPLIAYTLGCPYETLATDDETGAYARVLWCFYLSETYGNSVIPEIWYDMEDDIFEGNDIRSTTTVLAEYGVEFGEAFEEYCVWNWFTGDRDDENHYEEGGYPGWPEATPQATYSAFPVAGGSPPDTCRPDHLACNYIHFERGSSDDEVLHISYDGPAMISRPSASHVTYLDNDLESFYYGEIALNPWGNGDIYVEGFDEMNLVCLVVVNKSRSPTGDDMSYTFDAELFPTGMPEVGGFGLAAASPNPFTESTEIAYAIPAGAARAQLSIYNVAGRQVTTLVDGEVAPGGSVVHWDGRDARGVLVSSGVYFVRLAVDEAVTTEKVVLMR